MNNKEVEIKSTTRKTFLYTSALTVLATAGIVIVAKKESESSQRWINTPNGLFYGIYERHDEGINPTDIPNEMDILFEELMMSANLYNASSQELLNPKVALSDGGNNLLFEDSVLEKLINNRIAIAFGDTVIDKNMLEETDLIETIRFYSGLVALGGALGILSKDHISSILRAKSDNENSQPNSGSHTSRRKFLRNILGGTGLLLAAPLLTDLDLPFTGKIIENITTETLDSKQKNALSRILYRVEGLTTHFRPENHLVFFRNLLMADKLLTLAEDNKQKFGRKARIAFNVGSRHTGIEDFLKMGHDFCYRLISIYPEDFLRKIVKINGSLENFCSTKVISIPSGTSVDDIRKDGINSDVVNITDDKIIDNLLYKSLIARLNYNNIDN